MMSVSVIIPTYNRASQVVYAVCSVLAQKRGPDEVIVIDDGSSDATEEALHPYFDRIRYIKTENHGVSAARNRGIAEATGDWIAFQDSDDVWHPEKLRRQLECLERTGADVCFCASADESGEVIDDLQAMDPDLPEMEERVYPAGDCRFFKHPRHPYLQSMIVRKSVLENEGGFDESLKVAEDTKLLYGIVLDHGYAVVNERLVSICRKREKPGLSDTMDLASALDRYECYARVQAEVHERIAAVDPEAAAVVWRNLAHFVSRLAEIACALHDRTLARQYAVAGLGLHGDWKDVMRNMAILGCYPVAERRFSLKWNAADTRPELVRMAENPELPL